MPHILEDLPNKMEGQPPQKNVNCVLQGGPLPIISEVISPINGLING